MQHNNNDIDDYMCTRIFTNSCLSLWYLWSVQQQQHDVSQIQERSTSKLILHLHINTRRPKAAACYSRLQYMYIQLLYTIDDTLNIIPVHSPMYNKCRTEESNSNHNHQLLSVGGYPPLDYDERICRPDDENSVALRC